MGDMLKNAPNAVVWAVTVCFLGVLATLAILSLNGAETAELWSFVNRLTNIATMILSGGAFVAAGASAVSARKADKQTNGDLDARIDAAIQRARDGQ